MWKMPERKRIPVQLATGTRKHPVARAPFVLATSVFIASTCSNAWGSKRRHAIRPFSSLDSFPHPTMRAASRRPRCAGESLAGEKISASCSLGPPIRARIAPSMGVPGRWTFPRLILLCDRHVSYDLLIRSAPAEGGRLQPRPAPPWSRAWPHSPACSRTAIPSCSAMERRTGWQSVSERASRARSSSRFLTAFSANELRRITCASRGRSQMRSVGPRFSIEQNGQLVPREGPLSFRVPRLAHPFNRKPIAVARAGRSKTKRSSARATSIFPSRSSARARLRRSRLFKRAPPDAVGQGAGLFTLYRQERGAYLRGHLNRALALALGARAAAHFGGSVDVFHVRVHFRENQKPACSVDFYEGRVDERARFGLVGASVVERIQFSAEALDTHQPWHLTDALNRRGVRCIDARARQSRTRCGIGVRRSPSRTPGSKRYLRRAARWGSRRAHKRARSNGSSPAQSRRHHDDIGGIGGAA